MNEILLESLKKGWKENQKVGTASMTLGGLIQFAGSPSEKKKHLDKIKFAAGPDSEIEGDTSLLEGDFVDVTYRALSAAMMGDRALDFSNEGVLRRSAALLEGQTVFKDHNTRVDNWVGLVAKTFWDNKTKGLPPGINAVLRLDTVKDPMTVRGVLQGALHSASVTVSFEWSPSHPKLMEEHNFWNNLGVEVDGEVVRIVVTKILKYWEISLVWQGADEYAKQIDEDGNALNRYSFAAEDPTENVELAKAPAAPEIAKIEFIEGQDSKQEESMKLKTELEKVIGSFKDEEFQEALDAHLAAKVEAAKAECAQAVELASVEAAELKTKLEESEARIEGLSKDAVLGKQYLEDTRKEVVELYKKAKGVDGVKEVFLKTFEKADLELLKAWKEDYQLEAEKKFPLSCQKCQSTAVTRQSARMEEAEAGKLVPLNGHAADVARNIHG